MSSISAQGVVERASAELSKRINGLGLRSSKHHRSSSSAATSNGSEAGSHGGGGGKASVMERVTNVFCGGSNSNNVTSCGGSVGAPEKPSRLLSGRSSKAASSTVNGNSVLVTPQVSRRLPASSVNQNVATSTAASVSLPHFMTWDQLMLDERFLSKFFLYFTPGERRTLAQVCGKWRDVLYRTPRYWAGLIPVLRCRELRAAPCPERARLYSSLLRRGFHAVSLLGATDEDALDLVHSFPLAAKHVHSLSLRCSSVSDRGLEALLDHFQALFELELAGCNEITEAGLWACLTPRIVSLTLTDCINVADEAVGAVAQLLPSLYEFSLQAYHVTDAALGYFSPKQSNSLSILRLQSCWELTNHGVVNIGELSISISTTALFFMFTVTLAIKI
ncbi:F-box/LRR-repeat protein 16-like [Periplaneta americana]|uniref:F-box/LRR-repeat protein 16-like n=1 Tax=Periplaneta americana TaxID=6978 RepID=UPI0037E90AF3